MSAAASNMPNELTICTIVSQQVAGWDFKRVLTSRGANLLATLLLNPHVSDLTGSFRLYKRKVLEDLMLCVKGRAYVFQMEVSWFSCRTFNVLVAIN